jgi:hypothetical protein
MVSGFLISPYDQERIFSGRRDRDPDLVEDLSRTDRLEQIHEFLVHLLLGVADLSAA